MSTDGDALTAAPLIFGRPVYNSDIPGHATLIPSDDPEDRKRRRIGTLVIHGAQERAEGAGRPTVVLPSEDTGAGCDGDTPVGAPMSTRPGEN